MDPAEASQTPAQDKPGDGSVAGEAANRPPSEVSRITAMFDSTTKVLVAIGGLIAAAAALWAGISHLFPSGSNQAVVNSKQVAACEMRHSLTEARQTVFHTVGRPSFDSCVWPATSFADADGFTEVTVRTVSGPGQTESSDSDWADRITGPCRRFTLSYDFGAQGVPQHLAPFSSPVGQVTTLDQPGTPWSGDVRALSFYPARNEVDVLRNSNDVIANAVCAD